MDNAKRLWEAAIEVSLDDDELALIEKMGRHRYMLSRENGLGGGQKFATYGMNGQRLKRVDIDILGVAGEFAFAKHKRIPLKDKVDLPGAVGDGGWDFVVNGSTIDVKTTSHRLGKGNLMPGVVDFDDPSFQRPDYYVLVWPGAKALTPLPKTITIIGGVSWENYRKRSYLTTNLPQNSYKMNWVDLDTMDSVQSQINRRRLRSKGD